MSFLNPESILKSVGIFEPEMNVADFGCGAGYFTMPLSRLVGDEGVVYAVDIQESALETVRRKAIQMNVGNVRTVKADLEKVGSTGIAEASLHAVCLITVLSQSEKKEEIVKEAKRVLSPAGRLLIIEWNTNSLIGPAGYKIDKEETKQLSERNGLHLEREFNVDGYHYGLLFQSKN